MDGGSLTMPAVNARGLGMIPWVNRKDSSATDYKMVGEKILGNVRFSFETTNAAMFPIIQAQELGHPQLAEQHPLEIRNALLIPNEHKQFESMVVVDDTGQEHRIEGGSPFGTVIMDFRHISDREIEGLAPALAGAGVNPNLKISLYSKPVNKSFLNDFDNNNGRINYSGNLRNISKFKFSKIEKFFQYDPEVSFNNNNIIFFDNKGSILKFDNQSNLIWKKNYYSKSEKKLNPILHIANNENNLIVADNVAKIYMLDVRNGNLVWSKNNLAPINSQIKIYKDKFFIIDFSNTLRCLSLKSGQELWSIQTENSLIRSRKKLSMIIVDKNIYFRRLCISFRSKI